MRVYFDHNATTPLDPSVIELMTGVMREEFGNASSIHRFGQRAKGILDDARSEVADLIRAEASEVVFTSGGTEADNFAIRGVAEALEPTGRRHLVASAIEHEAVLNTFKALARRGWTTTLLPVDASGVVAPAALEAALTDKTALVSVMHANNEIGTIQPIAELAAIAHSRGALFHTDAVQSVAKIPVDVRALGVDLLSLSAHKFNGPKGVGALWIKRGTRVGAILTGGKHERNRRAGTENVPGIAGLGAAARLSVGKMATEAARLAALRDRLESEVLARIPGTAVNGDRRAARAQHDQHQLRGHRGGVAPDRARPRRDRRVDRVGLLVRHAGTVARAARHGPAHAPHPELDPPQPRRRQHRRRSRLLPRRAAQGRREAALGDGSEAVRKLSAVSFS